MRVRLATMYYILPRVIFDVLYGHELGGGGVVSGRFGITSVKKEMKGKGDERGGGGEVYLLKRLNEVDGWM